jgi:hypothetical protein
LLRLPTSRIKDWRTLHFSCCGTQGRDFNTTSWVLEAIKELKRHAAKSESTCGGGGGGGWALQNDGRRSLDGVVER